MDENEEEFDHQVTAWTVGQLRAATAGLASRRKRDNGGTNVIRMEHRNG